MIHKKNIRHAKLVESRERIKTTETVETVKNKG